MLKVLIITTDEPFYIPITIKNLLKLNDKVNIEGIIILPPTSKKRKWRHIIGEQLRFGLFYFFYMSIRFIINKIFAKARLHIGGRCFSVESAAESFGIPIYKVNNINSTESINLIKNKAPDLLVSIAASQIFSKNVINIPKWGSINVHNAPLPKYQGLMPSFWALYHNEKETATTVHYMTEKIDEGNIILQKRISITQNDTLDSLIKKTKLLTVQALLESFDLFIKYNGKPPSRPINKHEASYFSFPKKVDVIKFKKSGKKLLWKSIY